MSWGALLVTALGFVLLGVACGLAAFYFLDGNARSEGYRDGLLAGQHQAEQTHSDWHPVLSAESWNRPEAPAGRHRSPDRKEVPEPVMPLRPVLDRPIARPR